MNTGITSNIEAIYPNNNIIAIIAFTIPRLGILLKMDLYLPCEVYSILASLYDMYNALVMNTEEKT